MESEKRRASRKRYRETHREAAREYAKNYRLANPEKCAEQQKSSYEKRPRKYKQDGRKANNPKAYKRNHHLITTYGITLDDYNKMFEKQNGCCGACGVHQSELSKPLFVDHNHKTGEVRALLCQHCNTALGYVKDDVNILNNLIAYLSDRRRV